MDKALLNKELRVFINLVLIAGTIFILSGLISALENFFRTIIRLKVNFDLNKRLFYQLQNLPLNFLKDASTGEHMFKINYDIEKVVDFIVSVPEEAINIFPRLFLIVAIVFYLDWHIALFSLLLISALYLPIHHFTQRLRKVLNEFLSHSQNVFKYLEEVFSHIYLIKAFGKEIRETKTYLKFLIANMKIRLRNLRLEAFSNFIEGSLSRIITGLITIFAGYHAIKGSITIGTLTAIMLYLDQLMGLQAKTIHFSRRIILGLESCKRLNEILQIKPLAAGRKKGLILDKLRIEFNQVSFAYKPDEIILDNISFHLRGGIIGLVGPSGCGKTTILNLILRLYQPNKGRILFNADDLNELDIHLLRHSTSIALEEPYLWNDTLENNIRYANEIATEEDFLRVLKITGVEDFARHLPNSYKTVIGENACKISEGQKQKIALARALIKKPRLLILDEAMSSMDSLSEDRIILEIRKLNIPLVIVVSHRLSTIMAAEQIFFLKKPDTIVSSKPNELMETDSDLRHLFAAQFSK
jgi:ATP-binding cassette subfamily B protein